MSILVHSFDEDKIIADLKKSGKDDAIELIKAYKRTLENQMDITNQAIQKIRKLVKEDDNE